jgi:cell fate (sporulation/competence/biofilm development) regulator YlbF (YheA/YmcA/DUF963 family)
MNPTDKLQTIQRIQEVQESLRMMSHVPEVAEMCAAQEAKLQHIIDELEGNVAQAVPMQPYPYEG